MKNGSALTLHVGLLRIGGTIRDLKIQSRFAGHGQLVRGNLACPTILARLIMWAELDDNAPYKLAMWEKLEFPVKVVKVHKGTDHRVLHSVLRRLRGFLCDTERYLE